MKEESKLEMTNQEPVTPPEPIPRWRLDYNMVSALAISVISLCALVVSIYQTRLLVRQNELANQTAKAQMWPHLEFAAGGNFDDDLVKEIYLNLSNEGTGPAIIEEFFYTYQGASTDSWWPLYDHLFLSDTSLTPAINFTNRPLLKDEIIQVGEKITTLKLVPVQPEKVQEGMEAIWGETQPEITLCYRSVFGDRWEINGRMGGNYKHEQVERCTEMPSFE